MTAKRLREESGYSLVEVMVSIVILTIAILPMVSMFDMGLKTVGTGSNYDKARTLANMKLEQAKNLPFDSTDDTIQDLKDNFPEAAGTPTDYDGSGHYQSDPPKPVTGPAAGDFTGFEYVIEKQYMAQPSPDPADPSEDFGTCVTDDTCDTDPHDLIRVTVTVQWGNGNTYTTFGLVTR
jgi:prepilin-type N-terminal cleavage/methylation domain-containing protein